MKPKLHHHSLSLLTAAAALFGAPAPVHAADKEPPESSAVQHDGVQEVVAKKSPNQ